MRETIVFLSGPGTGLNVVNTRDVASPGRLSCHFVELAVLHHHCMDDAQERLVAREYSSAPS